MKPFPFISQSTKWLDLSLWLKPKRCKITRKIIVIKKSIHAGLNREERKTDKKKKNIDCHFIFSVQPTCWALVGCTAAAMSQTNKHPKPPLHHCHSPAILCPPGGRGGHQPSLLLSLWLLGGQGTFALAVTPHLCHRLGFWCKNKELIFFFLFLICLKRWLCDCECHLDGMRSLLFYFLVKGWTLNDGGMVL